MKTIPLETSALQDCVSASQREQVIVTQDGQPVAVMVGLQSLDAEQLDLCRSQSFWRQISERRSQQTISRAELEQRLSGE